MWDQFYVVELTHPLNAHVPTWNGSCGFCLETRQDYDKMFRVQQIKMHAGVATHMDAPSHCIPGGKSIADISAELLIIPACVIDVSKRADADYEVSVEDLKDFERAHETIPKGALAIAYTGWGRFWHDPKNYRNEDAAGKMHFPAFASEAAEFLVKRDVAGIAIDTLSPDCSHAAFPVHHIVLGAGKYIIENICNVSRMPAVGGYVIALPLFVEEATEAPVRIIGIIPNVNHGRYIPKRGE